MSSIRERFEAEMPGHYFLGDDVEQVETYLVEQGVIPRKRLMKKGATVDRVETLNLGEMDFAVRVHFGEGAQPHGPSVLMKQARPWVEQIPNNAAPVNRSRAEAGYFKMMSRVPALAAQSPTLIHHDAGNHVLVLQDFGESTDLSGLYEDDSLNKQVNKGEQLLTSIVKYLNTLHSHFLLNPPTRPVVNKSMRQHTHALMFDFPFRENTPHFDPALQKRATQLGARYLDFRVGGTLLHGDFTFTNMRICADEHKSLLFTGAVSCITGPPEFDFGVLVAHLYLTDNASAVDQARNHYSGKLDESLWKGFAGVEMVRRLVGSEQDLIRVPKSDLVLQLGKEMMLS